METPLIIRALRGEKTAAIPFWFMRQAGRYLPEYMAIRKDFPDFLSFCYTPDAACEVTLQPLARFDCDAAILFSDILVIPDALGMEVAFVKGEGPKLTPITQESDIPTFDGSRLEAHLEPVMQAIRLIRKALPSHKALIGFSGSPWTLACYMIDGQGSKDFAQTRQFAYRHPQAFARLIGVLTESVAHYTRQQIEAGAQVIQLFDSWAGLLPEDQIQQWVIEPTRQIVDQLRAAHPDTPIIGFARGIASMLPAYAQQTGVNGVGLDERMPLSWATKQLQGVTLQGNLDNMLLASNQIEAVRQTQQILTQLSTSPFIFNLGHGILPHTPIAHVEAVVHTIREYRRS